ncbi:MAG: ATP-dependent DNA helicase [Flavobacteriaceae bacterium]
MNAKEFEQLIIDSFPFAPTNIQLHSIRMLSDFLCNPTDKQIFVLRGYAGTGKTTLISTLVKKLWNISMKSVQMAPTGRAAKVISSYTNSVSFTIHRKIYHVKSEKDAGIRFTPAVNKHKNTLFIVDEASMISDTQVEKSSLLEDLISYVHSGHKCKLLLVGDTAQLPPVHSELSPALDDQYLERNFDCSLLSCELNEVVRQASDSGILHNATLLRETLFDQGINSFQFQLTEKPEIERLMDGSDIQERLEDSYRSSGLEETAIIVRSNKRANLFNKNIRSRILYLEDELNVGDYLMVVKNNYFWITPKSDAGFIANGDLVELLEIYKYIELYGFRFAEVKVKLVDYPKMDPFETVLILDTIESESPALTYEESNRLYQEVRADYENETSNYKKYLAVKKNKYFNALQVKFSYALTCHKAQGGQWDNVFIEQPFLPDGFDQNAKRWLYTAITRAKKSVYLIGFENKYFE